MSELHLFEPLRLLFERKQSPQIVFIVDEASWHIGYLDVKTGDWLHSRSMMVLTDWVTSVSWADHRVNLDHAQKQV